LIRILKLYLRTVGIVGTIKALWGSWTGTTFLVSIERSDVEHPFQLRVPSTDVSTCKHIFVRKEYQFEADEGLQTIVDGGACTGLASIYFANRYPQAKIIAIEPEPGNFELLVKNVEPYPNVIPVRAALWNCNETIELVDPGLGEWGYMTRSDSDGAMAASVRLQVEGVTLDQLMERLQLSRIDLMKLNVEGAEREIFANCEGWIDRVEAVVVKLHDRLKPGCTSSFFEGARGFDREWTQAGSVCMSRGSHLSRGSSFVEPDRVQG